MGNYNVFLSYRRKDNDGHLNVDMARAFCYELEKRRFKVFFDYNECTDGYFAEKILPAIRTCDYFVLLLTKGTLERCKAEGDWVRRELEEAIKYERKIVPVTPDGSVTSWPKDLPDSLKKLSDNDGIQITSIHREGTFRSDIGLLIEQRMSGVKRKMRMGQPLLFSIAVAVVVALLLAAFFVMRRGGKDGDEVPGVADSLRVDSVVVPVVAETAVASESPKEVSKDKGNDAKREKKILDKGTKAKSGGEDKSEAAQDKQREEVEVSEPVNHVPDTVVKIVSIEKEGEKKVDGGSTPKVDEPKVSKDFTKAKALYNAGKYRDALKLFEKLRAAGSTEEGLDQWIEMCRKKIGS